MRNRKEVNDKKRKKLELKENSRSLKCGTDRAKKKKKTEEGSSKI